MNFNAAISTLLLFIIVARPHFCSPVAFNNAVSFYGIHRFDYPLPNATNDSASILVDPFNNTLSFNTPYIVTINNKLSLSFVHDEDWMEIRRPPNVQSDPFTSRRRLLAKKQWKYSCTWSVSLRSCLLSFQFINDIVALLAGLKRPSCSAGNGGM